MLNTNPVCFVFGSEEERASRLFRSGVFIPFWIADGRWSFDKTSASEVGWVTVHHANQTTVLQLFGADVEFVAFVNQFVLRHPDFLVKQARVSQARETVIVSAAHSWIETSHDQHPGLDSQALPNDVEKHQARVQPLLFTLAP